MFLLHFSMTELWGFPEFGFFRSFFILTSPHPFACFASYISNSFSNNNCIYISYIGKHLELHGVFGAIPHLDITSACSRWPFRLALPPLLRLLAADFIIDNCFNFFLFVPLIRWRWATRRPRDEARLWGTIAASSFTPCFVLYFEEILKFAVFTMLLLVFLESFSGWWGRTSNGSFPILRHFILLFLIKVQRDCESSK